MKRAATRPTITSPRISAAQRNTGEVSIGGRGCDGIVTVGKLTHMNTDRYTRIVLTVIAASLAVDAGSRVFAIREAHAAETLRCEIANTVRVEGKLGIDTFGNPVAVKITESTTLPVKETKY